MKLMLRPGSKLREFLNVRMRHLELTHLQCDEIWTFVRKKQNRLTDTERDNDEIGDQFLYIALDQKTKLVPSYSIGKRSRENTELFMLDLTARIVVPEVIHPTNRPKINTDGWPAYPGAVDLAFANTVRHGLLIKSYVESSQPGRYGPPVLANESRHAMTSGLNLNEICTSHVERHNLSIRTFMRRFTRLALGFSKKLPNLAAATALYSAHDNFCRRHETLRMPPAMAAKISNSPMTMEELLTEAGVI